VSEPLKGERLDTQELEQIVNTCYAPLYRFAFSLCKGPEDAADLTQEAFRKLAEKYADLRDKSKVRTWLFTTVYRAYLARQRHAAKFPEVEISEAVPSLLATAPDATEHIDAAAALRALLKLDPAYRAPLTLFYLQDYSYKQIAQILELPIGTVMSRLARGKMLLREQLADKDMAGRAVSSTPSKIDLAAL